MRAILKDGTPTIPLPSRLGTRNAMIVAKLRAIALLDSAAEIAARKRQLERLNEVWTVEEILRREG